MPVAVTSSGRWMLTNEGVNVRDAVRGTVSAFTMGLSNDPGRSKASPQVTADERFVYSVDFDFGRILVQAWTCGTLGLSAKIIVANVGQDVDPTNDNLIMKATGYLPRVAVPDLALEVVGLRFTLTDADGNHSADVVLPGGTYAGSGTAGWTRKRDGRLWQYTDTTATPVNGVRKLQLRDQEATLPDMVLIKLVAKGGSYPFHIGAPGTVGVVEPILDFELGSAERCIVTGAVLCRVNGGVTRQKCSPVVAGRCCPS